MKNFGALDLKNKYILEAVGGNGFVEPGADLNPLELTKRAQNSQFEASRVNSEEFNTVNSSNDEERRKAVEILRGFTKEE